MTPSQYIKAQGLPSLAYVAREVGKPPQTLQNWFRDNHALFKVVVAGVKPIYREEQIEKLLYEGERE